MKLLLMILGLLGLSCAIPVFVESDAPLKVSREFVDAFLADIKHVQPRDIIANLNDYADQIFANLQGVIVRSGLDPDPMPDIHEGFNFSIIITYHGELDLTNGWLEDLSTLKRGGDVEVVYSTDSSYLQVTVPIAFADLSFTYDYSAQLMDLGPTGTAEGTVKNLKARVKIGFDFVTYLASLDEFEIVDAGRIDLNFSGSLLTDFIVNLLIDVALIPLHGVVLEIAESIIRDPLNSVVDSINDIIQNIVNPTTAAPAALSIL